MAAQFYYVTKAGAPASGVFQVETQTIVGTITLAGNMSVIVTALGLTGSPITLSIAVPLNATASNVASLVRAALLANEEIAAFFTVGGSGAIITLTRVRSEADDSTLNIAFDNDTSTGLTGSATSTTSTAGVRGTYRGIEPGTSLIDTTNGDLYQMTGTALRPVWTIQ